MAATPLHFGEKERTLYGVYHEPEIRAANAPACLLLSPFGEEATRSYRIFRQLADRLARVGAHVLRFDYYGSGDSAGDCVDLEFDGMVRDAATAQEELEALSGARRFVWIGLGLGGSVALRAAGEAPVKLAKIFLWDPALNGADYLAGLRNAHVAALANALDAPVARIERETPARMTEALGFELPEAFRAQLAGFQFAGGKSLARECHLISMSAVDAESDVMSALHQTAPALHCYDDEGAAWNSEEAMNAYFIPAGVLDYIAENANGAP